MSRASILLLLVGCGGPSPESRPPDLEGFYRGTLNGRPGELRVAAGDSLATLYIVLEPGCRSTFIWRSGPNFEVLPGLCAEPPRRRILSGSMSELSRGYIDLSAFIEEGVEVRNVRFVGERP